MVAFLRQHQSTRSQPLYRQTGLGHLLLDLLALLSMKLEVDRVGIAPARTPVFFNRRQCAQGETRRAARLRRQGRDLVASFNL